LCLTQVTLGSIVFVKDLAKQWNRWFRFCADFQSGSTCSRGRVAPVVNDDPDGPSPTPRLYSYTITLWLVTSRFVEHTHICQYMSIWHYVTQHLCIVCIMYVLCMYYVYICTQYTYISYPFDLSWFGGSTCQVEALCHSIAVLASWWHREKYLEHQNHTQ
jgi:hypothetical protein